MAVAYMIDPTTGNVALYREPVDSGAYDDPNSARNAPLNDPENNLKHILWHIQLDNMEVFQQQDVTINHPDIAAGTSNIEGGTTGEGASLSGGYDYSYTPVDHELLTHGLGYEPIVYVADGTKIISPGYIIQRAGPGGTATRYISLYVDTNKVYLREHGARGGAILPGISKTYTVLVIRRQRAAEGNTPPILQDFNETTGLLKLGDGRFSSDRRYLQVVPGGTPFGLVLGKSMDFNNGAPRFIDADGNIVDPVPAEFTVRIYVGTSTYGADLSTPGNYNGSFTGSETIRIQAP